MNKLLASVITGLFATSVYAQTANTTTTVSTPAVTKAVAEAQEDIVKAENKEAKKVAEAA